MESFSQNTRFSGRDSNRSHPEHHSQALLIGPNCSVTFFQTKMNRCVFAYSAYVFVCTRVSARYVR
jgi:hypothetical protein